MSVGRFLLNFGMDLKKKKLTGLEKVWNFVTQSVWDPWWLKGWLPTSSGCSGLTQTGAVSVLCRCMNRKMHPRSSLELCTTVILSLCTCYAICSLIFSVINQGAIPLKRQSPFNQFFSMLRFVKVCCHTNKHSSALSNWTDNKWTNKQNLSASLC